MFDISQAKTQVNGVARLALPYFLDACDEIERLRLTNLDLRNKLRERNNELEQLQQHYEIIRADREKFGNVILAFQGALREAGIGVIRADKSFPDDEVFIGYGPSGP